MVQIIGGLVLEPFAGSGTTLVACALEGFDAIGIEQDGSNAPVIEARVAHAGSEVAIECAPVDGQAATQYPSSLTTTTQETPMARKGSRKTRVSAGSGSPLMLARLKANVKSCDGEFWEVALDAHNVVVGPTGSGKSAVTQAMQLLYSGGCDDVAFRPRSRDLGLIFTELAPPDADELRVEGIWDNGATGYFSISRNPDGSYSRDHKLPPGVSKGDKDGCPHLPVWSVLDTLSSSGSSAQLTVAAWLLAGATDDDVQDALDTALPVVARARQVPLAKLQDIWAWGKRHFAPDDDRQAYYALAGIEDAAYEDARELRGSRKGATATATVVAGATPHRPPPTEDELTTVAAELGTLHKRLKAAQEVQLRRARQEGASHHAAQIAAAKTQHADLSSKAAQIATTLEQTAVAVAARRQVLAEAQQVHANAVRAAEATLTAKSVNRPPIDAAVKLLAFAVEKGHENCPACGTGVGRATLVAVHDYYAKAPPLAVAPEVQVRLDALYADIVAAEASVDEALVFERDWIAAAMSTRQQLSALAPILAMAGSANEAPVGLPGGVPPTSVPATEEASSVEELDTLIAAVNQRKQAMDAAKAAWATAASADGVVDEHDARIERDEHVVALVAEARSTLIATRAAAFAEHVQQWLPTDWPVTVETEYRGKPAFRLRLERGSPSGGQGLAMVIALARAVPGPQPQCLIGLDRLLDKGSFKSVAKALKSRGKPVDQIVLTREDTTKMAGWNVIEAADVPHLGRPATGSDDGDDDGDGADNGVDAGAPDVTEAPLPA